jgi:hypothetical protein
MIECRKCAEFVSENCGNTVVAHEVVFISESFIGCISEASAYLFESESKAISMQDAEIQPKLSSYFESRPS